MEALQVMLDLYLGTKRRRCTNEAVFDAKQTDAYVHMIFAWGFAKQGERDAVERMVARARELLGERVVEVPIHRFGFACYLARIDAVLRDESSEGLLFFDGVALPADAFVERVFATLRILDAFTHFMLLTTSSICRGNQELDAFDIWRFRGAQGLIDARTLAQRRAREAELEWWRTDLDRCLVAVESVPSDRSRIFALALESIRAGGPEVAQERLRLRGWLERKLPTVTDSRSTSRYYCLSVVEHMETMVRSLVD